MRKIFLLTLLTLQVSLLAKDAYIVGDAAKASQLFPAWTITQITKAELGMPAPSTTPPPTIPFDLRREGISGSVRVALLIEANGKVTDVAVWSSDNEKLNKPVLTAVKAWKFKPATVKGKKAAYVAVVPFDFNFTVEAPVHSAEELKQRLPDKNGKDAK